MGFFLLFLKFLSLEVKEVLCQISVSTDGLLLLFLKFLSLEENFLQGNFSNPCWFSQDFCTFASALVLTFN
jgi:hypothetical protein